jgi:excisionase family DNA binding protein
MTQSVATPNEDVVHFVTPWLTVPEVAARAQVGPRTIYDAIKKKRLRAARLGSGRGALRVHVDWCDTWLRSEAEPIEVRPLRVAK